MTTDAIRESLIILQARTGSKRLPGKVLLPLGGIALLAHCIRRLQQVAPVLVATSTLDSDQAVVNLAQQENAECFRGSELDVLDRYYRAAAQYGARFIIRATGDNPFVDIEEAKRVRDFIRRESADYVSGVTPVEGAALPEGSGVEAFSLNALKRSWQEGSAPHHREHVNEYILENPNLFRTVNLKCLPHNNCPELRVTVDTAKDLQFAQQLLSAIPKYPPAITTAEIIRWWRGFKHA